MSPQSARYDEAEVLREHFLNRLIELGISEAEIPNLPPEQAAILEKIVELQGELGGAMRAAGYDSYQPNPIQLRFHKLPGSHRWMILANRAGKSYALNEEVKWFQRGTHPYRDVGNLGPIWACAPTDEKVWNHLMPSLRRALGPEHIRKETRSPRPKWEMTNDIPIYFKNYAQDPGTFASEHIRLIAFDEAPPWDIFEEAWVRRGAGYALDIIGGATLTEGTDSWIYNRVMDEMSKDLLPDTYFTTGTLFENPYIPQEQKDLMCKGLKGIKYRIRVLGEVLPVGDSQVFDGDVLYDWLKQATEPKLKVTLDRRNKKWIQQDEDAPVWLWRLPEAGHEYILSNDPAEGKNTAHLTADPEFDETAGSIFDRHRREFVGEFLSGKVRPDETGELWLPMLSKWFNDAKTIIERNNHGHTVIEFARRQMQGRLYRPKLDRSDIAVEKDESYGYLETRPSRAYGIDLLARFIEERLGKISSSRSLRQMAAFVRKSGNRVEHRDGWKDDLVFAHFLCLVADADMPPPARIPDFTERAQLRAIALRAQRNDGREWYRKFA